MGHHINSYVKLPEGKFLSKKVIIVAIKYHAL